MDVNTEGQPSAIGPTSHHEFIDTALLTNGNGEAGILEKGFYQDINYCFRFSSFRISFRIVLWSSQEGMRRNGLDIVFVGLIKGLKINFL